MLPVAWSLLKESLRFDVQKMSALWICPCKEFPKLIGPINMSSGLRNLLWLCLCLPMPLYVTPYLATEHKQNCSYDRAPNHFPRGMEINVVMLQASFGRNLVNECTAPA